MKAIFALFAGLGIIGIAMYFGLALGLIVLSFYGLYLAFSASIWLGLLAFFVEPSPLIIGFVMFFFEKNLAQILVDFLNK